MGTKNSTFISGNNKNRKTQLKKITNRSDFGDYAYTDLMPARMPLPVLPMPPARCCPNTAKA